MSYYTNSNSSTYSMNDVNRFLHDYRNGQGSYDNSSNSMYNSLVNSTGNSNYNGCRSSYNSSSRDWCNTPYNSNGNYYSSSIFTN
jgi:hypothetical protein